MTELPNQWIDKASDISNTKLKGSTNERQLGYEDGFTDGATAYKQAVEKQIALERTCYQDPLAALVLDELLKSLQTLKPTSND
jgi:hypothetical protein